MNKKKVLGTFVAATITATVMGSTLAGCSLVSSNNTADMAQVIATVNISAADGISETDSQIITNFKDAVGTTSIIKRELIAYYLNVGYSYVNSGYSYSQVFNMLVDGLVDNAVMTQYAIMYLLDVKAGTGAKTTVLNEYNAKTTYIEKLEYLLTDATDATGNPDDPEMDIKVAKYNLYSSINNALDSYEQQILEDEDSTSGILSRSTPGGVDRENEDFYPQNADGDLDYNVYTGYAGYQRADSGIYEEDILEGSTKATRIQAYNNFMSTLISNGLVDPETENLRDVLSLTYIGSEYETQLESRVINKYYDLTEKAQENKLTDDGEYEYLDAIYHDLYNAQARNNKTASAFSSALGGISDTSFVLYSPNTNDVGEGGTYGYVYNILLPFDALQSAKLSELQSTPANQDEENGGYNYKYYNARNQLLKNIKTTDQREAWFNGVTEYAFDASEADIKIYDKEGYYGKDAGRNWLFFENNLVDTNRYEPVEKYIGQYSYNGRVIELEDGKYKLIPNKLDIDDMLAEFSNYVDFVLGEGTVTFNGYDPATGNGAYFDTQLTEDTLYKDADAKEPEINYEHFIYASGKVNLPDNTSAEFKANLLNKDSVQYKALAAVNELQYAYTTDTSVLSQYLGYSVTIGDSTGYIKEFETAAQMAIAEGPGAFTVCAGDYGWHLIYVTYTFDPLGGPEYEDDNYQPQWAQNVTKEGTFENLFYEWVKSNDIVAISTSSRTKIIIQFNKDTTVTKYQETYQDLLDLS